jgi:chemotaxis protein CheX
VKAEYINPFVRAAADVLKREAGCAIRQGAVSLLRSAYTTHEVTVLVAVHGDVRGLVLYGFTESTACAMATVVLGHELIEFDELAKSGIAEFGALITTAASAYLSEAGYRTTIAAPTVLTGVGTLVATVDLPRLVIPLTSDVGPLEIHVALRSS